MPRVVIELQANTQQAIAQIQAFARAQRDAFDAIKAGNPQLADAQVKVSKLTESTKLSAHAANEFNSAAKNLAAGGVRDLIGQVPILGNAVASLAGNLKGLPLALVAAGGAVIGVVSYLKDLEAQMLKTADATTALSEKAQRNFLDMTRRVAAMRATAAGRPEQAGAIELEGVIAAATRRKEDAIEAAEKQRAGAIGHLDIAQGFLNPQALIDKIKLADADLQKARKAADLDANTTIIEAREKFKLALEKIEKDLDTSHAASQEKRVADAAAAAEKQQQLIEGLTASSLATFKGLGAGFEDVVKSLELAQFVTKTQEQIAALNAGIEAGIDTHGRFAAGVAALQAKLDEAVRLGYVPTIEKTKELTAVTEKAAETVESAGERWLKSMEGISATLDDIIHKTRQAGGGGGGAGGGSPTSTPTNGGGAPIGPAPGSVGDTSGLERTIRMIGGEFQHGGVVPGSGRVPIIAHGGEVVIPTSPGRAFARGGGGGTTVIRIAPGAVQISGTIVEQQRGWDVLVEELGAALEARLR